MATVRTLTLGDLLKRYRTAAGLTQEELAAKAGLSPHGISDLERGARRMPRRDTIALIADALGLDERERATLVAAARQRHNAGRTASPTAAALAMPTSQAARAQFVGRAAERELIGRHLAGQTPPLLLFAGEPGIGKSRLLAEAATLAPAAGLTVLYGGSHRRSGQEPFAPIATALERHLAAQSAAERRATLRGCDWLVRLLPELADALAAPSHVGALPPEQERRLTFHAAGRYLQNVAGPFGTLLVLDDLQWAGQDALDLLAYLVRTAGERNFRVLVGYRDTEVRTQTPLAELLADLAREGLAERRALVPLEARDAEALLAELLANGAGDDRDLKTLRRRVLQRTGGVPFFLVSLAQGIAAGALSDTNLPDDDIPWGVAETLRQRIAALPDAAQSLLGAASIIGRTSPRTLLVAVALEGDRSPADVHAALDAASQARLLVEEGDAAYSFAHDLVREVVGADLSAARRALLHRRVAEALERGPGEPPASSMAYHLGRAGEHVRAIPYLERAADTAQARYAVAEAEELYRELIARLDEFGRMADAARTRRKLGALLAGVSRYADAIALVDQARTVYESLGDSDGAAVAAAHASFAWTMRNEPEAGRSALAPFLEPEVVQNLSAQAAAEVYAALGTVSGFAGRYAEQVTAADHAAHFARLAGDDRILAMALLARAYGVYYQGQLEECAEIICDAMPLIERSGNLFVFAQALGLLGGGFVIRGDLVSARRYLERCFAVAERSGDPAMLAFADNELGALAMYEGDWAEMRRRHEAAAELVRPLGSTWAKTYAHLFLGFTRFHDGNPQDCAALLDQAIALADGASDLIALRLAQLARSILDLYEGRPDVVIARVAPLLDRAGGPNGDVTTLLPTLAVAYLMQHQVERAGEVAEQAVAQCLASDNRVWLVEALTARGRVRAAQGRIDEAEPDFDEALRIARTIPYRYAEAHVHFAAGAVAVQRGNVAEARTRLSEALAIYERLGEVPFATRSRQMLAEMPA